MVNDYISQNTQLKPIEDFRCTLLVKKDKDINTLSFVSYKVDVNTDHFEELIDVNFWPQGSFIREFVPQERKQSTLADFVNVQSINDSNQPNKMPKTNVPISKNETINANITMDSSIPKTQAHTVSEIMSSESLTP